MIINFVLDGSNLSFSRRDKDRNIYDLARIEFAIDQLKEECSPNECAFKVFVDASLRHGLLREDQEKFASMLDNRTIEKVPAGTPADAFILRWAQNNNALVVTNDRYLEYVERFPWIREKGAGRFISGNFFPDERRWIFVERNSSDSLPREVSELVKSHIQNSGILEFASEPIAIEPKNKIGRPAYTAKVTSHNPHAVIFLIDQSGSMAEPWFNEVSKKERVAEIINETLNILLSECIDGYEGLKEYFDIALIGYGGSELTGVRSLIIGTTIDEPFVSITRLDEIGEQYVVADGRVKQTMKRWIAPRAEGKTPMKRAFDVANNALKPWLENHKDSFPPIVFNITDGDFSDEDPRQIAEELCAAHISSSNNETIRYPVSIEDSDDQTVLKMFEMSSLVPKAMRQHGQMLGVNIPEGARAFLFNSDANDVVSLLNIGTQGTVKGN
jgi:hypothetical protein